MTFLFSICGKAQEDAISRPPEKVKRRGKEKEKKTVPKPV